MCLLQWAGRETQDFASLQVGKTFVANALFVCVCCCVQDVRRKILRLYRACAIAIYGEKGGLSGIRKSLGGIFPVRDNHPAAGVIWLNMIGAAASQLLIDNMEHAKSPMKWADIKEIAEATYSLRYFL